MICNTKTGCLVSGTLIKDAEYKTVGQNGTPLLKVCIRYGYEPPGTEGGRRKGKLMDVDIWGSDADKLNGVLVKGMSVLASGELKSSQGNDGKSYYAINSYGEIFLSASAIIDYIDRQMDQAVRLNAGAPARQQPQKSIIDPKINEFAVIDDSEDLPF